jgi:N6-adenosine-specific RNA methylase IME4
MTLEFHPYANLFPLIEGQAFAELVNDIADNGLREPIVLFEGKILDGRNRYRAALQAGVIDARGKAVDFNHHRPTIRNFMVSGIEGDPLAWVISANLHRRHLDDGQRAMVAAELAKMGHGGARAPAGTFAGQAADMRLGSQPVTIDAAAKLMNVGARTVEAAKAVHRDGAPELVDAAKKGEIAVTAAVVLSTLPKEEQTRIIRTADPAALYGVIKQQRDALTAQKKVKRAAKEVALGAKQKALPAKKYGVIYADPAWRFEPRSRESGMDRAPENHYPTMTTDDIRALPVRDIAATDCALFLWATAPMLVHAISVMEAWGFDYKSNVVWLKDGPAGTGYWFRNKHELLLLGTRGNPPAPAQGLQWRSLIEAEPGEHSAKPPEFAVMIEEYFPTLPKIELNARKARPGWDVWGNEAPELDAPATAFDGPAFSLGSRELGFPADDRYREPSGASVAELCPPGTIIRTNYGTGPYEVVGVTGPHLFTPAIGGKQFQHWSLCLCHVNSPKRKKGKLVPDAWVNEVVAVDGRLLGLFENNSDEVFIVPPVPEAEGDFADAPADGEALAIPAFLRRKSFADALGDLTDKWREEGHLREPAPERCPDTADMLAGEG